MQQPTLPALQALATLRSWQRGRDIVSQDEVADRWFCVVEGVARQCLIRPDGRRQIVDILLPGDFFGVTGGNQRFAVQAIVDHTIVADYPRRHVETLMGNNPRLAQEVHRRMLDTLARLQENLLIVSTMTSVEKVRAFLGYMAGRLPRRPDGAVVLPLSRYDIADQLGISAETVSRAISELKSNGAIHLGGPRQVQLLGADTTGASSHRPRTDGGHSQVAHWG
jgi:CRP/FNR family nitrogen fixation transcriptional regulator